MLTCTSRLSVTNIEKDIFVCFRSGTSASANQKAGKNAASTNIPSQWSSMPSDKQYRRVPLTSTSSEYKEMETLFKKTVNKSVVIKGIERVQNPFMWEKYQRYFILTNDNTMSSSCHAQNQFWTNLISREYIQIVQIVQIYRSDLPNRFHRKNICPNHLNPF